MSEHLESVRVTLQHAWVAWSFAATLAGGIGVGMIALGVFAASWVPFFPRKWIISAGAAILIGAAVWQSGRAEGAFEAFRVDAQAALEAEKTRATKAEAITDRVAAQAARDLEAAHQSNERLKELSHAMSRDKDRDRECVDRDTARRLRQL